MAQTKIKQVRGASQGSILFLGTNSVVSEDVNKLSWNQSSDILTIVGGIKIDDGNQQSGYVLTTDSTGLATWSQSVSPTQSIVEIPISGTQNGVNKDFVLSYSLLYPANLFFINGQLLQSGVDYSISGTALSIDVDRPAPSITDSIRLFGAATGLNSGLQELNGLTSLSQTFTTYTDSNLTYSINSSVSNHEFNISLSDDISVFGTLSVGDKSYYSGDLLPTVDSQYDLGTSSFKWRSLHVASGSIYVGGVTISSNNDAISINRINLGTEDQPRILTYQGGELLINGTSSGVSGTSGTSGTSATSGTSGTSGTSATSGTSGTSGTGFNTISNPFNNRILTSDGTTNSADAESNLTFDGVTLNVNANLFVSGTFSISGSSSTIDTTTLVVADPIIALGHSQSGTPILDEGFMFVRGTGLTQAFIWDESDDTFAMVSTNDDHTVVGNIDINGYSNLRVGGLTTSQIRISDGAQANYILISDSTGLASWTASFSISGVGDNRILTSDGSSNAVAESNLTFDGLTMSVSGDMNLTGTFSSNLNQISSDALTQAVLLYLSNNF